MKIRLIGFIFVVLLLGVVLIGCTPKSNPINTGNAGNTANTGNSAATGAKTYAVDISGFAFSPSSLNINKGDIVVWTNKDNVPHTITSDAGGEVSSEQLSNGQSYSHTFNSAGTFAYHCSVHPSMKAEVVVI